MKTKIIFKLLTISAFLLSFQLSGAEDSHIVVIDGVTYCAYNAVSASVCDVDDDVSDIVVPETVEIGGTEYVVNAIDYLGAKPNLRSISAPAVEGIPQFALTNCINLENADFPSATFVGHAAFSGCKSLVELKIPNVECLEQGCFMGCSSLQELVFKKDLRYSYSFDTFNSCKSIERLRFEGAIEYDDITLVQLDFKVYNHGLVGKGPWLWLFKELKSLTELYINHDQFYPVETLYRLPNLTSVTIGNNAIPRLYDGMAKECPISEIHCMFPVPPVAEGEPFQDVDKSSCKVYVPAGCADRFRASEYWSQYANIIEDEQVQPPFDLAKLPRALDEGIDINQYERYIINEDGESVTMYMPYWQFLSMEGDTPIFANMSSTDGYDFNLKLTIGRKDGLVEIDGKEYRITAFGDYACAHELAAAAIEFGPYCESIGDYAFYQFRNMDSEPLQSAIEVRFPASLKSIGKAAFCKAFIRSQNIVCAAMEPPTVADDRFFNNAARRSQITLTVPLESVDVYREAPVWSDFNIVGSAELSVGSVMAEASPVVDTEWYDMQGRRLTEAPADRVAIRVDVRADGSRDATATYRRR